jgi:hypothetical protein
MMKSSVPYKGLPVLLAEDHGGFWRAWCPFCRRWHTHSPKAGYRMPHCAEDEHFPDGYLIVLRSQASKVKERPHPIDREFRRDSARLRRKMRGGARVLLKDANGPARGSTPGVRG